MRITVASTFQASPPTSGAALRNFHLYRNVARRHAVELVSLVHSHAGPFEGEIAPGFFERRIVTAPTHHAAESVMSSRVGGVPVTDLAMARFYTLTPAYVTALRESCARADVLVASHPYLAAALRLVSGKPLVYEAPDVEVDLKRSVLPDDPAGRDLLSLVALAEADCCRDAERVFACSEADRERLIALYALDPACVEVAPNGVDLDGIAFREWEERVRDRSARGGPTALFLASWHGPNNDAARQVLALAAAIPHVRFVIGGSVGAAIGDAARPPNAEVTGHIDEATKARLLREADVALNPVSGGAGTNLKLLEYCAAGIPVVSTAFGVRGFGMADGRDLFIRDLAEFPAAIDAVLAPGRHAQIGAMVRSARSWVEEHADWRRIGERMAAGLDAVAGPGARPPRARSDRLVSVLVPMRDAERYVDECLASVRGQTHADLEVLVVDDGSTDGSAAIVRRHADEDPRIRLLAHPGGGNRGVSRSLELALAHARGARVALLDADDAFEPGKLERQVAAMDAHPEVIVCHTAAHVVGEADALLRDGVESHFAAFGPEGPYRLLERPDAFGRCPIVKSTAMIDVRALRAVPFAAPQWFQSEDWLMFTLLALQGPSFLYLEDRTARYRMHPDSYTSRVLSHPLGVLYSQIEFFLTLKARAGDPRLAERLQRELDARLEHAAVIYADDRPAHGAPGLEDSPAVVGATVSVRWLGAPDEDLRRGVRPRVELTNSGHLTFASRWPLPVHLSYHWLDAGSGEPVVWDGRRTPLIPPLVPGSAQSYSIDVERPGWVPQDRAMVLRATLVLEGGFWFDVHSACFADWRLGGPAPEPTG